MNRIKGYSDPVNHAFAFAAKHHDRQVRMGTRLPYLTSSANVAIILTRYGRDEETVIAGILHDVMEDSVRDGYTGQMLDQRIADKFGPQVLGTLVEICQRRAGEDGVDFSSGERKEDFLERLRGASPEAKWVAAACEIHAGNSILSDLRRTFDPESVWSRQTGGRLGTLNWYRQVLDRLESSGFDEPIVDELRSLIGALEDAA